VPEALEPFHCIQRPAQHTVLAHQVLDRTHLFFVIFAVAFFGGKRKSGAR
jgi:hypothetical protein